MNDRSSKCVMGKDNNTVQRVPQFDCQSLEMGWIFTRDDIFSKCIIRIYNLLLILLIINVCLKRSIPCFTTWQSKEYCTNNPLYHPTKDVLSCVGLLQVMQPWNNNTDGYIMNLFYIKIVLDLHIW